MFTGADLHCEQGTCVIMAAEWAPFFAVATCTVSSVHKSEGRSRRPLSYLQNISYQWTQVGTIYLWIQLFGTDPICTVFSAL